ncbi:arf-GAP with SH3 domain, ANK repeat and PH domain-containing protein 2-like isoform X2 [Corythoichthys intestinalis]|uniref:arf-GAP with SH3 domain, ANK repeat and PH domain-containing protein 2-like isoform X2 n=1 Tax=Corythoichthys intestinalis TaxID=161448 RepID=UPI0025A501C7|nr:arf-GAP with SH3 domain, ANK repeat and PH domain-containing protein 2-like isoform X2 [Corythoichthys intestinalis]
MCDKCKGLRRLARGTQKKNWTEIQCLARACQVSTRCGRGPAPHLRTQARVSHISWLPGWVSAMAEVLSVPEFIRECNDDYAAPTTSSFSSRMTHCRNSVAALEEVLDVERSVLSKLKKALKSVYASGLTHVEHEDQYVSAMEKLGDTCACGEDAAVGAAFLKFAVFSKELTALFKNLVQNMNNIISFPLESLLKGDLRGVKGDLKKPFDKSWKDYETKLSKLEKEKREHAKQHGMIRTEFSGGEIAEEMEKERRAFQLNMCEYLLKVNDIKVKKGVEFLHNLIKYFHAQCNFFQDGLTAVESLKPSVEKMAAELAAIKQSQDSERKQLTQLRDVLKSSLQSEGKEEAPAKPKQGYSLHQLQGNKAHGTERSGVLSKRSEGLRKVWQKRKCSVKNGFLSICHATANRAPAKLNLLTCQVKKDADDKRNFDLFSHDRTYHFQAEDETDCQIWVWVLQNSKEEALNKAFRGDQDEGDNIVQELTGQIVAEVKKMAGNQVCCDCGAPGPSWLSTNLGVLICIECSGIHREIGVHYSRIQSLDLDVLGTSELLLAKNIGNAAFNQIMEAELSAGGVAKPQPTSDMQSRKDYITRKYVDKALVHRDCTDGAARLQELYRAVRNRDILALLQVYGEGADLTEACPQPNQHEPDETVLHLAVRMVDRNSLHIVDFLAQNSANLDARTSRGSTALHYCCLTDNAECLKLLLRGKASVAIADDSGETPLDVARRLGHAQCENLLTQAQSGKFNTHVHVEYEWRLRNDDLDESEDELEDKPIPSRREERDRPVSCFVGAPSPPARHRGQIPSMMISNETYGAILERRLPPGPDPPLPPRGPARGRCNKPVAIETVGRQRSSSDPLTLNDAADRNTSVYVLPVAPPPPPANHRARTAPSHPPPLPPGPPPQHKAPPSGPRPPGPKSPSGSDRRAPQRSSLRTDRRGPVRSPETLEPPTPKPRTAFSASRPKRVRAIYRCSADNPDELTFEEGEVIVVEGEEDSEWWVGHVEAEPARRGVFPVTFVHFITE